LPAKLEYLLDSPRLCEHTEQNQSGANSLCATYWILMKQEEELTSNTTTSINSPTVISSFEPLRLPNTRARPVYYQPG